MKREPLAKVEVRGVSDLFGVRVGDTLALNGCSDEFAHKTVSRINAAVEAREAPLLALLAEARANLRAIHNRLTAEAREMCGDDCPTTQTLKAIDAADPGQWVPLAKYRELERVLGDLKEELDKR